MRVAGLVLVRQKPGPAKGVMFITIEDETGVANLVIGPSLYEQQRRLILTASMISVDSASSRALSDAVRAIVMPVRMPTSLIPLQCSAAGQPLLFACA